MWDTFTPHQQFLKRSSKEKLKTYLHPAHYYMSAILYSVTVVNKSVNLTIRQYDILNRFKYFLFMLFYVCLSLCFPRTMYTFLPIS